MPDSMYNQLVSEVTRDVITQMAPQEVPLVRATSEAYFKNPEKVLATHTGKDEMLGFGTGEVVTLLTPVVLAVTTEVVTFLGEEIKKSVKDEGASFVNVSVKALFKKFRPAEKPEKPEKPEKQTPPPLTGEQLARVREIALKKARQLKLSERSAKLLADSLVGSLAVSL
jgi:hypothetical protein